MGRLDQENAELKDFMGIGKDIANYGEARKHVYASSLHMRGESKHVYIDKQPMYNVDLHAGRQHYEDAIAVVQSNNLGALQRPMTSRWLYNNDNSLANGSLVFAAMGRPDWNKPGGRQQVFACNSAHEQREVEKVNDAHQIMHASSGRGNSVNCKFPVNGRSDPSGSGMKGFPFVAPVSYEHASTMRVHQIPIANNPALTPFLAGGRPSMRMQPADSSIKASSTQLTIFYAGQVNVYNDVSSGKAQEIMLKAASDSFLPLNMDMSSRTSIHMVAPPLSGSLKNADPPELSWIDPSTCQPDQLVRDQVCIGPLPTSISQAHQAEESCMPGDAQSTHLDHDEPTCPRALPQARKASLVRFLERRKDRVRSRSPYLVEKTFL